jgi:hypothetical protein
MDGADRHIFEGVKAKLLSKNMNYGLDGLDGFLPLPSILCLMRSDADGCDKKRYNISN